MSGPATCGCCGRRTRYLCDYCGCTLATPECDCCEIHAPSRVTPEVVAALVDLARNAHPTALIADVPRCPCGALAVVPGHCRDCWAGELATARRERLIGRMAAANRG